MVTPIFSLNGCIGQLVELSELESHEYKSRAYKNAAEELEYEYTGYEDDFQKCEDFTWIDGIGSGINLKIMEYKVNGIITKLQTLRAESCDKLDPRFYKVREGFITRKITLQEAHGYLIWMVNAGILNENQYTVAGSFRRGKSYVGDLDILVDEYEYDRIVTLLSNHGVRCISQGEYKSQFMIDSANNVPMDIIKTGNKDFSFQLLYLTGSREMNIKMRRKAKDLGMLLNQYGLYDIETGESVFDDSFIPTEQDIFEQLGMKYVSPQFR